MEDQDIIALFLNRDEKAVESVSQKYSGYLFSIAKNILCNNEDSEECVNDTYWYTWQAIPPTIPNYLKLYMGKITRNLALNYYEKQNAKKRGKGEIKVVFDELEGCISSSISLDKQIEDREIAEHISKFLYTCSKQERVVFIRRYYFGDSLKDIAKHSNFSLSKVKNILYSMRKDLKSYLEKEGLKFETKR